MRAKKTATAKKKVIRYTIIAEFDALTMDGTTLQEGLEKLREDGSAEIADVEVVEVPL